MTQYEKTTFSTQEGPDKGRGKAGPDRKPASEAPKPKKTDDKKQLWRATYI